MSATPHDARLLDLSPAGPLALLGPAFISNAGLATPPEGEPESASSDTQEPFDPVLPLWELAGRIDLSFRRTVLRKNTIRQIFLETKQKTKSQFC